MPRRLRELAAFAARLEAEGSFGETEQLTVQIAVGEYLNHVAGGIPMNQGEFAAARRPRPDAQREGRPP